MKFFWLVLLNVLVAVSAQLDSRIIGGGFASRCQFPHMASLRSISRNNLHFCGGSIVSDRWILTAGHCIDWLLVNDTLVSVGQNDLLNQTSYRVSKLIVHPQFKTSTFVLNDVGLVKTVLPIRFGFCVNPIKLNTVDIIAGQQAVVSGWGKTSSFGDVPRLLKYLGVTIMSRRSCQFQYFFTVPPEDFCTRAPRFSGVCSGDSGSPLISNGTQIGIASRGFPPCGSYPDVYTRVDRHLTWIQSVIS